MGKIKVLINIIIVCIILIIAIYLPNIVFSYLQKSLEGKLNYVDVGVKTYEVKYNNIWEKVFSIYNCYVEDGEFKTIPIATEKTEDLKENLTRQVVQQFKKIQEGIVIYKFSDLSKENLVSCEKYAIYSSYEANGISFWKLKYQREKETIQIVMDTEFNYIYALKISMRSKNTETMIKNCIKQLETGQLINSWLYNIVDYFDMGEDISLTPNIVGPFNFENTIVIDEEAYVNDESSLMKKEQYTKAYVNDESSLMKK
ncbi:MAG: hypothetical protein HFJ09_03330, partial [Lachnospiraceae bacterium]|nr:hypothetical protein [Lachnospiraceae bacterium]